GEIEHRAGRPRQRNRLADVVVEEGESGMSPVALGVVPPAGEQVVDGDHLVAAIEETIDEVAADEPGSSQHDRAHYFTLPYRSSRRTTSSSSGVEASRTWQSVCATIRCRRSGVRWNESPGPRTRSSSSLPSSPVCSLIVPERTWMVSSLRRWYCRLSACPLSMWRVFPT